MDVHYQVKHGLQSSTLATVESLTFYIGLRIVRTDGPTVMWLPKFLGWIDYQIFLGMGLRSRVELRYKTDISVLGVRLNQVYFTIKNSAPVTL